MLLISKIFWKKSSTSKQVYRTAARHVPNGSLPGCCLTNLPSCCYYPAVANNYLLATELVISKISTAHECQLGMQCLYTTCCHKHRCTPRKMFQFHCISKSRQKECSLNFSNQFYFAFLSHSSSEGLKVLYKCLFILLIQRDVIPDLQIGKEFM